MRFILGLTTLILASQAQAQTSAEALRAGGDADLPKLYAQLHQGIRLPKSPKAMAQSKAILGQLDKARQELNQLKGWLDGTTPVAGVMLSEKGEVTGLLDQGPAEQGGVRLRDIIVLVNDKPAPSDGVAITRLVAETKGKVKIGLVREGKVQSFTFEKRPMALPAEFAKEYSQKISERLADIDKLAVEAGGPSDDEYVMGGRYDRLWRLQLEIRKCRSAVYDAAKFNYSRMTP